MCANLLEYLKCFLFHFSDDFCLGLKVHDIREEDLGGDEDDEHDSILSSIAVHKQLLPVKGTDQMQPASCRTLEFSHDGKRIYTGGAAGDLCALDAERACTFSVTPEKNLLWKIEPATEGKLTPLLVIHQFAESSLLATGDDAGGVRVWDERICGNVSSFNTASKRPQGCVLSWKENEDYISELEASKDGNTLLATSADGRLSVFDLKMARDSTKGGQKSFRLSDDQEDELLSLRIMKNGRKVVCGTQEGILEVFSWGTWGDCSDRFPGHPSSIDALLKVDEDTLLTGSSDGLIRVVQIHPDKLLGVIGEDHGGFPIERLGFNSNRDVVGSVSHDNHVRLWDTTHLKEDYEDGSDDEDATIRQVAAAQKKSTTENGSDDDWEDMDEVDEEDVNSDDDSDDDSDESENEEAQTLNDKRTKRLKTENEKFFDDL